MCLMKDEEVSNLYKIVAQKDKGIESLQRALSEGNCIFLEGT